MNYEEMWNDLKEALLEKKTDVRETYGKMNLREISLLWVLRQMQKLDPTITDEMLTYPGDNAPFPDGI
ncbi:hypothetical protein [Lutispora thermophila]|uniref:Uncharacterized protein n=1 Tax=Lutispora thermophila DSM 19022 TaxID=1122184 RepID=A0A1M6AWD0_9FIRM|nr:hypothetical protein [Lutispora thermophila]SHI40762.1 hypothetical protein SAMN02745176_00149 [Lutispora thermophila DSM 19022]